MDNDVMTHLTLAGVVTLIIEQAKRSPRLGWITQNTDVVSRVVSGLCAIGVGFGITVMGDQSAGWVIHVPSLPQLYQHGWEAFAQFMLQEMMYRSAIKPNMPRVVSVPPAA